jgi:DNA-binding protein
MITKIAGAGKIAGEAMTEDTKENRMKQRTKKISDAIDAVLDSVRDQVIDNLKCVIMGTELQALDSHRLRIDEKSEKTISSILEQKLKARQYDIDVVVNKDFPFDWIITNMVGPQAQLRHVYDTPLPDLRRSPIIVSLLPVSKFFLHS